MTESKNSSDVKKRLIVVEPGEGRITIPNKEILEQVIATLEAQGRQYFIIEI